MVDERPPAPLPHIIVPGQPAGERFTPRGRGGGDRRIYPVGDRRGHARGLRADIEQAVEASNELQANLPDEIRANGVILVVEGWPGGFELAVESLDLQRSGIELLSVAPENADLRQPERAVVYVPNDRTGAFFTRLDQYANEETESGTPRNQPLVANIQSMRLATLSQLWTDPTPFPDGEEPCWWELWLRKTGTEHEQLAAVSAFLNWRQAPRSVDFANRTVTAVFASRADLSSALATDLPLAELRSPSLVETPADLAPVEQRSWTVDLLGRIQVSGPDAPVVCVLDTGVYRHSLFEGSLDELDVHHVVGGDGRDRHGHGTEQAGLALLGDLTDPLTSANPVVLRHALEAVKILPDPDDPPNDPETYVAVTVSGTVVPEVGRPDRRRVYCLAITRDRYRSDGRPTSWSAAIDAMAFGTDVARTDDGLELMGEPDPAAGRLFVVAAGNIRDGFRRDHLTWSDLQTIEDPAQSWNALTVGGCTDLDGTPTSGPLAGWTPIAQRGELSPFSRSSLPFQDRWPVKPDILMESGNVLISPASTATDFGPSVSLTTTSNREPWGGAFTTTGGTSAAAAQAARLAAIAWAEYPDLWPETIRALLVHESEWTEPMRRQMGTARGRAARRLVRRYGFGVPTIERVLQSAKADVTLISQAHIHPFEIAQSGSARLREMHVHDLPWPSAQLLALGDTEVRLRATLSYFVEPNPSSRGWKGRYAYPSHGLRFDIRRPGENTDDFRRRLNRAAATEETGALLATGQDPDWRLGPQARSVGSLHSDMWTGTAAELADSGMLGVYPVGGWWKNNNRRDRAQVPVRYSLLVSLKTPAIGVDLYTPISTRLMVPVAIET